MTYVAHCQIIFLKWNLNENIQHNIKFCKNKYIWEKTSANHLRFFYRFGVWFYVSLCACLCRCLHLCLSLSEYLWMRERDRYTLSVFLCWYLCLCISVEIFQGERDTWSSSNSIQNSVSAFVCMSFYADFYVSVYLHVEEYQGERDTWSSSNSIQNRLWEMIPPVHQHC